MLKVKPQNFDDDRILKEKIGLEDGGHTLIYCSNCGKGLLDIWKTQPNAIDPRTNKPFEWKIKAKCCYCKDFSFITEVQGKFSLAGFGKIKEDDESQDIPETFPGAINEEGDILIIDTVKA
jgi:hypothetical protein